MGSRHFHNDFPDYHGQHLLNMHGKLSDEFSGELRKTVDRLLQALDRGLSETDDSDYTVYTGCSGIALLHLQLYKALSDQSDKQHLEVALSYIKRPLRHLKGRKHTFMCGDAGPLALGAVLYSKLGKESDSRDCIRRLELLHQAVCGDTSLPDELLFGRVGYLYALVFVQSHLGEDQIDKGIISKVCHVILDGGQALAQQGNWKHPLMYMWHEKYYLGSAHGLAGIFYILMKVKDATVTAHLQDLIKPSIDFMMTLRFPSGNCPSSIGSDTDKLIHWCHGAPGWIPMFVQAYKTFSDTKYLDAAKGCAEVIWQRGILQKGYGICHGTSGNGYAFLTMFKLTRDQKYLYRACKFAEWCFDYGKHGCGTPDRPYSLFEGLAGTVYYLTDLLDPGNSCFPAFEL